MQSNIHFKFDANQEHQIRAIDSVLGLFEGFPRNARAFYMRDECVSNIGADELLDETVLFHNMRMIQEKNGLPTSASLNVDEGFELEVANNIGIWRYPSFTIEMETGTGKTYAYLRTIYELRRQLGFGKFIVVVPSVAVYEGFIKAAEMTQEHFRTLYHNEYLRLISYDGERLGQLRDFSHSQFLTVMVMTISAFNKVSNKIFKITEKLMGEKLPFHYVQEVRPIFILDECQNYITKTAKEALRTLHPLFALKYSATAGDKDADGIWQYDNLIYQLDPLQAFRRNLVKHIQVSGVTECSNANTQTFFRINNLAAGPKAEVEVKMNKNGSRELGKVSLKRGDDLEKKTKNDDYAGWIVDNIDLGLGVIEFENGERYALKTDEQEAEEKREIFRGQIDETVRLHMELQEKYFTQGIKILSLFFIDRVANYRGENGLIRKLFEETFNKYKQGYDFFKNKEVSSVHEGYFAKKKVKDEYEEIETRDIDDEKKNKDEKEAEKIAFDLIMRRKERLLSFEENVSFIFAHSALKEGWDNPNVFQICTLAQRYSERRKRQEIGRGMRLCVDQSGTRVQDSNVNILTVIANESYEDFVDGLQKEYRETGNALPPPPSNAVRKPAKRNDAIYKKEEFVRFWNKLIQRTDYAICVDTDKVVNNAVAKLSQRNVASPEIMVKKGMYGFANYEIIVMEINGNRAKIKILRKSSTGADKETTEVFSAKSDLAKSFNDEVLKGFVIVDFEGQKVQFSNSQSLAEGESCVFEARQAMAVHTSAHLEEERIFPVFNIIARAAQETMLTRKTVIQIFERISDDRKKLIFKNPEGFASAFIFSIKEVLADHVASNIEYFLLNEIEKYDFAKIFPPEDTHPQHELVAGSAASLYDLVQYESDVERQFLQNHLNTDKKVVCYFKFPDSFKIKLPRIIQNYVPDWGVIRQAESGDYSLELVRETKATANPNLLQYTNEKRKILCAQKHFEEIGVGYRHIAPPFTAWWEQSNEEQLTVEKFMSEVVIVPEVSDKEQYITHLPVYSLTAACGEFGITQVDIEENKKEWVRVDRQKLSTDMFVSKSVGRSMEPEIPDGAYCIFKANPAGPFTGRIFLFKLLDTSDPETGASYSIKKYVSHKGIDGKNIKIELKPLNTEFESLFFEGPDENIGDRLVIVAEYIGVI